MFCAVFQQLHRCGQCTYSCFPWVHFTSTHNILSKPLAAPLNHRRTIGQRWDRNESCRNNYHQYTDPGVARSQSAFCHCAACQRTTLPMIQPRLGGSVVSVSDSWPGGCEFDPRLRRLFFPAYFRLSPLQKHVRKEVCGFGKKSCVSTGVRKPGNTYASPTAMIWPKLLKWRWNPIQPTNPWYISVFKLTVECVKR